jgi:MoxR-like ATPase
VDGLQHYLLPKLIKALSAKVNVWIAGPSQGGKTTAAKAAAKALGLKFHFHGSMTMAHQLEGFVDGAGHYHETQFVQAFRNGGLVLLDEVDRGSNEALLAMNAPLANRIMSLPNGELIEAHPDFVCIAAANTWGGGATSDYCGAARIDAAFLQRFGARLAWDYDTTLEVAICGNPEWAARVQATRAKARAAGLKVMITPQASISGARLIEAGFTADEAADMTYLADLSPDQRRMVAA